MSQTNETRKLPLHEMHLALGAKMVPFAGYEMPVQYKIGVLKEHNHTRAKAGLFDVSHMGQCFLNLKGDHGTDEAHEKIAAVIETVVPGEIKRLGKGRIRYSVLLNDEGGILDDLMITRPPMEAAQGRLFMVVNAAVKDHDFSYFEEKLGDQAELKIMDGFGLLALQGPAAASVMAGFDPDLATMPFMSARPVEIAGAMTFVSRCGYTGEDGYEISIRPENVETVAKALLAHADVEPIGLGARDSLRLESGLCLYGHDLSPETTPVEGNIAFVLGKRRRDEGGFAGAERILAQLKNGPKRLRVGIQPEGRAPVREGVEIQDLDGTKIGEITSGGFGPSFGGPVAMGYVPASFATTGTQLQLILRGKAVAATVADLPFVTQNYYRAKQGAKK
ncbi:MAG: glycine cleavage system aminomethyltransferase GcvT [bacterium]